MLHFVHQIRHKHFSPYSLPFEQIITKNKFDDCYVFDDQNFLVAIILTTKIYLTTTILVIEIFWSLKVHQLIPI
jgi:hypothetical protein